jgi:hypothetical protein
MIVKAGLLRLPDYTSVLSLSLDTGVLHHMPKTESTATRAPRGTKPVMAAFFTALDATPEASRAAIAKAAQVMIRDELKLRREKVKAAAAKSKARKPPAVKAPVKAPKIEAAPEPVVAKPKRARKVAA